MRKPITILALSAAFLLHGLFVWAQEVSFTVSAPKVVEAGEQFQVNFILNANGSNFQAPEFGNLTVLMGPSTSSSSSIQIVNGQMTQNYNLSFTYILQAPKEGTATISPATVEVKRKSYSTSPVTIEVVKGSANSAPGNAQNNGNQQSGNSVGESSADIPTDEIFVRILTDKKEVYQGEPISVTLKIYSKINLSGLESLDLPKFDGFYKQDIETPQLNALQRENVNGQVYGTGVLQRFVIFPQKSGNLEIDPYSLEVLVQQRVNSRSRSVFDDFFGPSYQNVKKRLTSNRPLIKVKPHPAGKPESFSGAVGSFTIDAKVDKTEAKTDDAIAYKITLSGKGNLKLTEINQPVFPPDFEVFDPKVNANFKNTTAGQTGSKSWEYLMIPRHDGQFEVPPLTFSYFDPDANKYKTLTTKSFTLTIAKGEDQTGSQVVTGVKKEDIQYIGSDIRYIKSPARLIKPSGSFYGSRTFYLLYLSALILFAGALVAMRRQLKQNADLAAVRKRKANKIAIRRLKLANEALTKHNCVLFYNETANGLWGYLGHKLGMPTSVLTIENVSTRLTAIPVDSELITELKSILEECEYARFAPKGEATDMQQFYTRALKLITQLDEKIK